MKHLKVGISAMVLVFAIVTSFAFRNTEEKNRAMFTCTWYDFNGNPGEEFDPAKYSLSTGEPSCPDMGGNLCGACVDSDDIYTSGPYAGLPRVDNINTAIYNVVNFALMTGEDNAQEGFNEIAELKAP
jgi:hypothetical protein